jgi:hypothetical protein
VTTTAWDETDLAQIDRRDEVHISSLRPDGTLTSSRIIWAVSLDGRVYVRSVNGPDAAWYRSTRSRHEGQLTVGRLVKDVTMLDVEPTDSIQERIDGAYRAKYAAYPGPVARITADQARATTLELAPR